MIRRVYVVVLNWNGCNDTIQCLESVLQSTHGNFQVVVCDNASSDGSVDRLRRWARGDDPVPVPGQRELAALLATPVPKPVALAVLARGDAEAGAESTRACPVVIIETGANLGFAGGCNVGVRYALAQGDADAIWLLNNDTIVAPGAMRALVDRLSAVPDAGQCGSRLVFADEPHVVQAFGGGRYSKWLGTSRPVGIGSSVDATIDVDQVERASDYVQGASLMVTVPFLRDVGLLNENYFLYYEEIDWSVRAGARWRLAYAHESVVYHKEGRSIGSSSDGRRRSITSDYYGVMNRLRFTAHYFPHALPTVLLSLAGVMFNRIRRRQSDRAWMIARLVTSPVSYRLESPPPPPSWLACTPG